MQPPVAVARAVVRFPLAVVRQWWPAAGGSWMVVSVLAVSRVVVVRRRLQWRPWRRHFLSMSALVQLRQVRRTGCRRWYWHLPRARRRCAPLCRWCRRTTFRCGKRHGRLSSPRAPSTATYRRRYAGVVRSWATSRHHKRAAGGRAAGLVYRQRRGQGRGRRAPPRRQVTCFHRRRRAVIPPPPTFRPSSRGPHRPRAPSGNAHRRGRLHPSHPRGVFCRPWLLLVARRTPGEEGGTCQTWVSVAAALEV